MSNGSSSGSEMSKRRALPGTSSAVVAPDLASLFECPVCFDYVLPPILQCQSGHLVCSSCRPKLTCCPTCRGPLGNIRNLAMEKVASTVMFPCKYAATGCSVLQLYSEKVEHEEVCEFRPFQCPCPGASCKWLGSLDQVMPHLVSSHKSITTLQGEDIVFLATDINLPGAVDWVMMQSCFGHCFMLVLEKQEKFDGHQQFFALVQLIGSRKQAENFGYRLELNRQRRRLTWEATPRSIHEGIATAIVSSDCLVFDTSVAALFADNAVKLLHFAGYKTNEEGELSLCFTTKSGSQNPAQIRILCGPVINSATRNKETEITFEEYRRLLLKDMKDTCGDKNSEKPLLESLVDTIIKTSFLQVSACQGVSLNFDLNPDGPQHRGNKGGVFLQYTSSRLSTIRKKYEEQVVAGIYPELPEVENVDFSILKEPEEWNLLFNFLLEYPSMIDRIAKDMISGKSKLHLVCNFLSKLCSLFSVYYRKIRILLEPRDHLIPLVQARLLLAMSVEQILDNGLAILNICKIEHM